MNVWFQNGAWQVRGVNVGRQLIGRSSFKAANLLSMHFAGKGDEYPGGAMNTVERWIEHNQNLLGRDHVVLRVFGETAGWEPIEAGTGMFGSPAQDQGIHNVEHYRNLCRDGARVTELTALHVAVLREAFRLSHETGCIWEWCIIATLKHTDGLCTGVCDHVIRQTAEEMRALSAEFPRAAFVVNAINEWDAHNSIGYSLGQVNQLAARWYRWVSPDGQQKRVSFTTPAPGWEPEQWPEAMLIVDHGGKDVFDYDAGIEAGKFQMGAIHPVRKGNIRNDGDPDGGDRFGGREWWEFPDEMFARLRQDSRGAPIGATESMFFLSKLGTESWYRNPNGWNNDLPLQLRFMENALASGPTNVFDYWICHDDIGAQTDIAFNPDSEYESALREFFGGIEPGPGPDPEPPPAKQVTYAHVIAYAYREILEREPDRSGLEAYDEQMRMGLTEAEMRESLIRSEEYRSKFTR